MKDKQKQKLYLSPKFDEQFELSFMTNSIFLLFALFVSLVIWGSLATVDEVASCKGEIEPDGYVEKIQHFDGGIVDKIYILEGDVVRTGQLLLELKSNGVTEDLKYALENRALFELNRLRIKSLLENKPFDTKKYIDKYPDMASDQEKLYYDFISANKAKEKIVNEQLSQVKHNLSKLNAKKSSLEEEIPIAKDLFKIYDDLSKKGNVPKVKKLEEEKKLIQLKGRLEETKFSIKELEKQVEEYQAKLQSFHASYIDGLNNDLEEVNSKLSENEKDILKLEQRQKRLKLYATADGVVKKSYVLNSQEIVEPGKTVFEIIPIDKSIIANIKISPTDVGYIHKGDTARIKISSYDYIRHGYVQGTLILVSPSTFKDKNGTSFYKGVVQIDKNYVGNNPEENIIIPGMIVQAEIVTGKKSIISYLLKPIQLALSSSLNER